MSVHKCGAEYAMLMTTNVIQRSFHGDTSKSSYRFTLYYIFLQRGWRKLRVSLRCTVIPRPVFLFQYCLCDNYNRIFIAYYIMPILLLLLEMALQLYNDGQRRLCSVHELLCCIERQRSVVIKNCHFLKHLSVYANIYISSNYSV